MTVSVLIPTYNSKEFILNTLDSVFRQSHAVDEIIIYDDGSTDDTITLIRQNYSLRKNIHIFEGKKNIGILSARKLLISKAKGDIIFFLDHDDEWKENYVSHLLGYFSHEEYGLIVSSVEFIDHYGNITKNLRAKTKDLILSRESNFEASVEYIFLRYPIPTWSCVSFRRDLGNRLNEIQKMHSGEEFCFASLVLNSHDVVIAGESLVRYRTHSNNASNDAEKQFETEIQILVWFLANFPFLKSRLVEKTTSIFGNAIYRSISKNNDDLFFQFLVPFISLLGNKKFYYIIFSPIVFLVHKLRRIIR